MLFPQRLCVHTDSWRLSDYVRETRLLSLWGYSLRVLTRWKAHPDWEQQHPTDWVLTWIKRERVEGQGVMTSPSSASCLKPWASHSGYHALPPWRMEPSELGDSVNAIKDEHSSSFYSPEQFPHPKNTSVMIRKKISNTILKNNKTLWIRYDNVCAVWCDCPTEERGSVTRAPTAVWSSTCTVLLRHRLYYVAGAL